jgi:hypothetical protein
MFLHEIQAGAGGVVGADFDRGTGYHILDQDLFLVFPLPDHVHHHVTLGQQPANPGSISNDYGADKLLSHKLSCIGNGFIFIDSGHSLNDFRFDLLRSSWLYLLLFTVLPVIVRLGHQAVLLVVWTACSILEWRLAVV